MNHVKNKIKYYISLFNASSLVEGYFNLKKLEYEKAYSTINGIILRKNELI